MQESSANSESKLLHAELTERVIGEGRVLVERKTMQILDRSHEAQVMNYFRGAELEIGLLFNFGAHKPQFRRFAFANENKNLRVHPRVSAIGNS